MIDFEDRTLAIEHENRGERYMLKDVGATLDYHFDWRPLSNGDEDAESDWLETDEDIAAYEILADEGITVESDSEDNGRVTVWLSGGEEKEYYDVTCKISTTNDPPRVDERTLTIFVLER